MPHGTQKKKNKATWVGGVKYYIKFSEELQKNVGVLKTKKKGNQEMIIEQDAQFIPKFFVHSITIATNTYLGQVQIS